MANKENSEGIYEVGKTIYYYSNELDRFITPSEVIHLTMNYPTHDWVKEKDGSIDFFAYCYEYHNGPKCKRCGYSFCECCECCDDVDEELNKPCHIERYLCPHCHKELKKGDKFKYCPNCGQLLDWED